MPIRSVIVDLLIIHTNKTKALVFKFDATQKSSVLICLVLSRLDFIVSSMKIDHLMFTGCSRLAATQSTTHSLPVLSLLHVFKTDYIYHCPHKT